MPRRGIELIHACTFVLYHNIALGTSEMWLYFNQIIVLIGIETVYSIDDILCTPIRTGSLFNIAVFGNQKLYLWLLFLHLSRRLSLHMFHTCAIKCLF